MIYGLGERLRALRTQFNFSQKKVADTLNISVSVLYGYETGERTPSLEKLLALSNLYRVSVDYLLGIKKEDTSKIVDASGLTDEQFQAVCTLVDSLKLANKK